MYVYKRTMYAYKHDTKAGFNAPGFQLGRAERRTPQTADLSLQEILWRRLVSESRAVPRAPVYATRARKDTNESNVMKVTVTFCLIMVYLGVPALFKLLA